jgi:hypothetical protein
MKQKLAIFAVALFIGGITAGPALADPIPDAGWGGDPPCLGAGGAGDGGG